MITATSNTETVRRYGRVMHKVTVPGLTETQQNAYSEFLQHDMLPSERIADGLQAVFSETFPIHSYDGSLSMEFVEYELGEPRHTVDECRYLGLTFGTPLKIRVRLHKETPVEESIYLGVVPLMIGGGEFIINGAERVIVTQIQRSPGADFADSIHSSGKRLHSCRIIPERGSWIQVEISSKDMISIRIDRSAKIPGTVFLRALDERFGTDAELLRAFYETDVVTLGTRGYREKLTDAVLVSDVVNEETGETIEAGTKLDEDAIDLMRELGLTKVEVIRGARDELIINTLLEDDTKSHEEALLKLYSRMRPGNPPQFNKAKDLFEEMFYNPKRYNFGPIGRFRLNRKFDHGVPDDCQILMAEDYYRILRYLMALRHGEGETDDIDHLENRRIRTIKDLVMDEFRKGMQKLQRSVRERMSTTDQENLTPRSLINSQTVSASIEYFFARGELSQVVDQSNPLSQLTHERRLSALGPGGLNRKRAGFEVRDVHTSHYGRICPIETPEGTNIGLIVSLSIYASVDRFGFLVTPYLKVTNRILDSDLVLLRADEEFECYIAQSDVPLDESKRITADRVMARHHGEFVMVDADRISYVDVSPKQLVGVAASLIPFLEHDDANRALMGSNMQRQAVPLVRPQPPIVATGMEPFIAQNTGMLLRSDCDGTVTYADAHRIVIQPDDTKLTPQEFTLRKYVGLNERTCLNQKPIVREDDRVTPGQLLTEGAGTALDVQSGRTELALGRNVLVAFMSWEGTNFEDAILVSERLIKGDVFTSIHIEEFTTEVRETMLGKEEITREIAHVSEAQLANLDDDGLIQSGTKVVPGDILVGKIAPKSKSELSAEDKLLYAIFGRVGEDVKNESLEVKPGIEGYVIDVQRFRRKSPAEEEEKSDVRKQVRHIQEEYHERMADVIREKFVLLAKEIGELRDAETGEIYAVSEYDSNKDVVTVDGKMEIDRIDLHPATKRRMRTLIYDLDRQRRVLEVELDRKVGKIKRGDELPTGVLELVKVYVAVKRKLSVGDKMAGRHGNKGVISRILPEEDMPFLPDGTPVDMVLNPLGVPSRMNFGQILETHLGWAAHKLGFKAITPVFDGASEVEIRKALVEAGLPEDGKTMLHDGRTGDSFDQKVTVGFMYMLKLHHLVADKVHARATGPYSLITQQPLGGKARSGGQRLGEMEVWALEAYGAANTLQELLTVKSDDIDGRTKVYESMVKGDMRLEPGTPISFEVLCNEVKGLGLNLRLEKRPSQADEE